MARPEDEQKRLRQYLNTAIRGDNTNAILKAASIGATHLIDNVEAVNDMLYIVSAKGRYLDDLLAGRGITRPENVGLSDDVYRELGIAVTTRKQIRDLIHEIIRIMYGDEYVRVVVQSDELEPYALEDGDTLIVQFDDTEPVEVLFSASQFANINQATAQEVSDAITKEIRRLGRKGAAFSKDDGSGGYVNLISATSGPSSTLRVLGGKAQNKLKFPMIRPTGGVATTQWSLTQEAGGVIKATWSGGPDPFVGRAKKGDYVNIYGTSFDPMNRGTFTVSEVMGGLVNNAYITYENPIGVPEIVNQGTEEGMLFFYPKRFILNSRVNWAGAYQTEARLLEVFLPATTKVVRRDRKGAAHLRDGGSSSEEDRGPYLYDETKGYIIGSEECLTTVRVDSNIGMVIGTDDSSAIPDAQGNLVFAFGTDKEEGPVPYIARPSSNSILVNPSYVFQNVHDVGTNISLISQNYPYQAKQDGSDYPFYITDVVSGRIYAEDLIRLVQATGIRVVITIIYPDDEGLGKWGTEFSEKVWVWGEDKI